MTDPPLAVVHQPGFNEYADQGDKVLRAMIALIILGSTLVLLRLTSRHLTRAGFWWDDVLVVISLFLAVAPCICNIVAVKYFGLGKHIYVFSTLGAMKATTGFLHTLYFFQIFFNLATNMTKLTMLAFYYRIFPIAELKRILIGVTAVVLMYGVAFTTLNIFQCRPIRKYWEIQQPGHCINPVSNLIISGSINTVLDFVIVCLPIPLLWRLRTSTRQKCVLTGTFLMAGFVCFVSVVRVVKFSRVDLADVTWDFVWVIIWSSVEPVVGIFGACLPSLRPLVTLFLENNAYRSFAVKTSKTFQSSASSVLKSNQSKSKNSDPGTFARLDEYDGNAKAQGSPWRDQGSSLVCSHSNDGQNISVYSGRGQGDQNRDGIIEMERISDEEPPQGVIRVRTEITLSSSKRLDYDSRLY